MLPNGSLLKVARSFFFFFYLNSFISQDDIIIAEITICLSIKNTWEWFTKGLFRDHVRLASKKCISVLSVVEIALPTPQLRSVLTILYNISKCDLLYFFFFAPDNTHEIVREVSRSYPIAEINAPEVNSVNQVSMMSL